MLVEQKDWLLLFEGFEIYAPVLKYNEYSSLLSELLTTYLLPWLLEGITFLLSITPQATHLLSERMMNSSCDRVPSYATVAVDVPSLLEFADSSPPMLIDTACQQL
ncbi:hypothetical protein GOBAR_AA29964 [Gossypium barbadense]|uniref:Uncharacterized protein n=1 Tax=Gossypium barbadense TaxID=3634 RepID=A0A2P5WI10_GOSBA|nr:hypothetical protein GOBAR_AA29964 [Gossypium barbadense]